MAVRLVRKVEITAVERVLWRLTKGERVAQASVREMSHGWELRFVADGVLRWSQLFPSGDPEFVQRALEKRQDFERLGWRVVP